MQAQSTLICCVYRSLNLLNARLVLDEALKARIREWGSLRKERDKELSSAQGDFTLPLYHPVKLRNSHCLVPPSSRAAPHAHSCPPPAETRESQVCQSWKQSRLRCKEQLEKSSCIHPATIWLSSSVLPRNVLDWAAWGQVWTGIWDTHFHISCDSEVGQVLTKSYYLQMEWASYKHFDIVSLHLQMFMPLLLSHKIHSTGQISN